MNIIEFQMTGKYEFEGIVVNFKSKYTIKGNFKTSNQDYPNEKVPLYASTVNFKLYDKNNKHFNMLTESEHQELEEILNDKIDEHIEANPKDYLLK